MDCFLYLCGLGNPGIKYINNRHNVGYMFLDFLKERYSFHNWMNFKEKLDYSYGSIASNNICLLKPKEYMNNSGKSLRSFLDYYKIAVDKVMIIYDDVDIKLGGFRIRKNGSGGSHNGMNDVILNLKTQQIKRIRIGIGPKPGEIDMKDFVLSDFKSDELVKLKDIFERLSIVLEDLIKKGIDYVISRYGKVS